MENLPKNCEQIKAVLETLAQSDVSSTARLVAVLEAIGITDRAELQRLTGVSDRMIRHARQQVSGNRLPETDCQTGNRLPPDRKQIAEAETDCRKQVAAPSRACASKESSSKIATQEKVDSPLSPQGGKKDDWSDQLATLYEQHANVSMLDGRIVLHNGTRAFWLDKFGGDAERLDLALIQAANYVQPESRRPLETQVSSQLARMAADKRDRDGRYAAAARVPKGGQTPQSKPKRTLSDVLAERRAMQ